MRALPLRLTHLLRLVAIVLMVARIVIAAAPYADAAQGGNAVAHVEDAGTRLHHAHDDADCLLCAAQQIVGPLHGPAPAFADAARAESVRVVRRADAHRAAPVGTSFSRAPPLA